MEDKHREIISNHIACLRWHTLTMRWQPGSFWLQFVYVMKSFHLRHHWLGSSLSLDEQMHRPYGSKTGQSTLSLIALRSLGGRTKCVWRWIETMAWNRMALLVAGHPRWGQFVLLQLFPRSQSKLFGLHRLGHDVGILSLRTTTSRHHEILHLNAYAVWVCLSRQRPPASGAQDEWPFINCHGHCQWPNVVYRGGTSAATAAKAAAAMAELCSCCQKIWEPPNFQITSMIFQERSGNVETTSDQA